MEAMIVMIFLLLVTCKRQSNMRENLQGLSISFYWSVPQQEMARKWIFIQGCLLNYQLQGQVDGKISKES